IILFLFFVVLLIRASFTIAIILFVALSIWIIFSTTIKKHPYFFLILLLSSFIFIFSGMLTNLLEIVAGFDFISDTVAVRFTELSNFLESGTLNNTDLGFRLEL